MSFNSNLLYFLDKLSGFSTNVFKLMPQGSTDGGPNKITRITLPANALLNTRSFKLHFTATTSGNGARLPADISTLVERVEVSAGGVQLSQGMNFYNTLCNAKAAIMGSRCDSVTGHSEVVRRAKFDGVDIAAGTGAETYTPGNKATRHVIDKWEGFLGTCEPKILDASILPDLVVSIYWAPTPVLASVSGNTTTAEMVAAHANPDASYAVSEVHATIETIGLADSVYDNMVTSMIAQKGFLEIPFKQYFSFNSVHTGNSRFTVAAQSLDRIYLAWRADGYDTQGGAVAVPGHATRAASAAPGNTAGNINNAIDLAAGRTLGDYGGAYGCGAQEKYITKYQRFKEQGAADALTYQLQLNGAYYPQFPACLEEMYQITKTSLPMPPKYNLTHEQLRETSCVQCIRLNMPNSEETRTLSGLDTRSVSLNGYVNTTGTLTGNANLMIFAEVTSTLRVGSGRQLEVII